MVKLPDFYEFVPFMLADGCYTRCQSNCSCIAYAFVNGIGCLVWSEGLIDIQEFSYGGEDLFLCLARAKLVENNSILKTPAMCIVSFCLVGLFAYYVL